MDKLNLNLDDLEVDSFQTNPEQEGEQGTVQGQGCGPSEFQRCDTEELNCEPSVDLICGSQPWCAPNTFGDCVSEVICRA